MDEFEQFTIKELKYMNQEKREGILNTFQCIRVPVTTKEKLFLYFRKFPTENLINLNTKQDKKQKGVLNLNVKKTHQRVLDCSKTLKYENPNLKVAKTEIQEKNQISKKILNNIPVNRTLLVLSLDKKREIELLRTVFSLNGKIRRIFQFELKKTSYQKFFYLVIFKQEDSLIECFNTVRFQWNLMNKFLRSFRSMEDSEKEIKFQEYYNNLEKFLDFEEGEWNTNQNKEGFMVAEKPKFEYQTILKDLKRKKKKEQIHGNYYDFANYHQMPQNPNKNLDDSESDSVQSDMSELDENKLENPDYMAQRKRRLITEFKKLKKS